MHLIASLNRLYRRERGMETINPVLILAAAFFIVLALKQFMRSEAAPLAANGIDRAFKGTGSGAPGGSAPPPGTSAAGALPPGSAADAKKRLDAMSDRDISYAASFLAYDEPDDAEGKKKYQEFLKMFAERYDIQRIDTGLKGFGFKGIVLKPRFPGDKVIFGIAGTEDFTDLVVDAGQVTPGMTMTDAFVGVARGLLRLSPAYMAGVVGQYALSTAGQAQYNGGLVIANQLVARYGRENVMVVGHSLGGGIATYVGAMLGVRAVGFNSAPLGPSNLDNIRRYGAAGAENNITQINASGELVSTYSPGQQIGEQFTVQGGTTSVLGNHRMENILIDKPLDYNPPRPLRR